MFVVFNGKQYKKIVKTQSTKGLLSSAVLMPGAGVRQAISNSVIASSSKNATDTRGGYHEEGGVWGTNSAGEQVPVGAKPGAVAIPSKEKASMNIADAADPAAFQSISGNIQGGWHVHPSGTAFNTDGKLMGFGQDPSPQDQKSALAGTNLVVGAASEEVTFFNSSNSNIGQITLDDFMKLPQ